MFKNSVFTIALLLAGLLVGEAQITVPYTFTTTVPVSQLNTNLSTIADGALKRSGGTLTGNVVANSGVTVDGVDISATLGGTGTPTFSTVTVTGTGSSAINVAGGINAGSGDVNIVDTSGRIPSLSSTYFASLSGANLVTIPASTALTVTPTSVSFNSGNFTASGGMTWGVDAGDFAFETYAMVGKQMHFNVYVTQTDVTAPLSTELRIALPNGCNPSTTQTGQFIYLNAATAGTGVWVSQAGVAYISLATDPAAATNWTATAADNTQVRVNAIVYCT